MPVLPSYFSTFLISVFEPLDSASVAKFKKIHSTAVLPSAATTGPNSFVLRLPSVKHRPGGLIFIGKNT